jgi:predicted Rossmann fold flavoprotein
MKIIVIGGGAAGFFSAITILEKNPKADVTILERGKDVLQKVKISGGGRCNVTHACFINRDLVKNYPRGEKALMSPFSRFAAGETIDWFEKNGVQLKVEEDGRMFPVSDNSQTIVDCLYSAASRLGVKILRGYRVESLQVIDNQFIVKTNSQVFKADKIVVAAGSSTGMWSLLESLGHTIIQPVPSLFTFNIKDERIKDLAGLSVPNAEVTVEGNKLTSSGPLLITHWGLSGPGILRLSAWGARELSDKNYHFKIKINWTGFETLEDVKDFLNEQKLNTAKKQISNTPLYNISSRLWLRFLNAAHIPTEMKWADINKKQLIALAEELTKGVFEVKGKSTFKDEFVTAGGVRLDEVNFKTFESKIVPNLYFAGEILDIDAITGGFNFQAAWTGGWIVGNAMGDES